MDDIDLLRAVAIEPTQLLVDAIVHVRRITHLAIFNHSVRVYLHAMAAVAEDAPDATELFLAAIFHDSGTAEENNGVQRFEVEGADAAARFLTARNWAGPHIERVWEAIALHTSPGIAERRGALARGIRLGVLTDFGRAPTDPTDHARAEQQFPRLDIEQVLGDAVVTQAVRNPEKAPASSWPGGLFRAHTAEPDHAGVNPAF